MVKLRDMSIQLSIIEVIWMSDNLDTQASETTFLKVDLYMEI